MESNKWISTKHKIPCSGLCYVNVRTVFPDNEDNSQYLSFYQNGVFYIFDGCVHGDDDSDLSFSFVAYIDEKNVSDFHDRKGKFWASHWKPFECSIPDSPEKEDRFSDLETKIDNALELINAIYIEVQEHG